MQIINSTFQRAIPTHLSKLEKRKRRGAVIRVVAPQDRVYLRIEARVPEPEQEGTEHGEVGRRRDVGHLLRVTEGSHGGQVDEDQEKRRQVDDVAHNDDRVAAPAGRFVAEDAEECATWKT